MPLYFPCVESVALHLFLSLAIFFSPLLDSGVVIIPSWQRSPFSRSGWTKALWVLGPCFLFSIFSSPSFSFLKLPFAGRTQTLSLLFFPGRVLPPPFLSLRARPHCSSRTCAAWAHQRQPWGRCRFFPNNFLFFIFAPPSHMEAFLFLKFLSINHTPFFY